MNIKSKIATTFIVAFLGSYCSKASFLEKTGMKTSNDSNAEISAEADANGSAGGDSAGVSATVDITMRNQPVGENLAPADPGEDPATIEPTDDVTEVPTGASEDKKECDKSKPESDNEHQQHIKKDFDEQKGACLAAHGNHKLKFLHVSSANNQVTVDSDTVLALKVTGTHNVVNLKLNSTDVESIAGVCVFIAGNENAVNIDVSVNTGKIAIVGRGNKSQVNITVAKDRSVDDVAANLAGNMPKVTVSGEGSFACSSLKEAGNDPVLSCAK